MVRPKKSDSELQTEKIVIYVTPEMKQHFKSLAADMKSSESKIGELAVKRLLLSGGGASMQYANIGGGFDLTGPLSGGDLVYQRPVDLPFSCSLDDEKWVGSVAWISPYDSHVEFFVQARGSGFKVIAGPSLGGWFLALPVHEVSLDLASPNDLFYNEEKALACGHLNRVDGVSAVCALKAVYNNFIVTTDK